MFADDELAAVKFMQSRAAERSGRCAVAVQWKALPKTAFSENRNVVPRYEQPVRNMLLFMHAWSEKLMTLNFCRVVLELLSGDAVKMNAAMRHVAEEWVLKNPVPVGGPGLTVEVYESLFARRKYNRDRVLPQAWVVGGVCRETDHCFLTRVADRSVATLISVWRGYYGLEDEHYTHLRVNHWINEVDPVSGAHTQTVESLWSHAKQGNKACGGTHRSKLDSYLYDGAVPPALEGHDGLRAVHVGGAVSENRDIVPRVNSPLESVSRSFGPGKKCTQKTELEGLISEVANQVKTDDPVRGKWNVLKDKAKVWIDVSSLAHGVVVEVGDCIVEDAVRLRPDDACQINVAELNAAIEGLNRNLLGHERH
uniref:DDE_Tnp_IS1595 domain-containing protein n=1 Tax=Trichuris muris TaxID=70415 RepID=A0A5S6QRT8_TRIMR